MAYGTVNADVIGTSVAGSNLGAGNATVFKNRIINGDMRIDQRNAGASVTPVSGDYLVDRWFWQAGIGSKFTAQQNAGSVTPPAGFTNYMGFTSTSAYSIPSDGYFLYQQKIEGLNVADLGWGTADAKPVTVSAWVRSSLTGTFGGVVLNSAANRWYVFSYTITSANTWTQISITIPGDTTGTWLTTNGIGVWVRFSLGTGSGSVGTPGSWGSTGVLGPTGQVNVSGTNGATFYVTGVQLEVGSSATGFEYVNYGSQEAMCQRYYYKKTMVSGEILGQLQAYSTTAVFGKFIDLPVTMRATPTGSVSNVTSFNAGNATGSASAAFTSGSVSYVSSTALGTAVWGGSSGLSAGNSSTIGGTAGAWIAASAEL